MSKPLLFSFFALIFTMSCGPTLDKSVEEVKSEIVGTYCHSLSSTEEYKLVINEDGTFSNMRFTQGVLGSRPVMELCQGDYELILNDDGIFANFKGEKVKGIVKGTGEVKIYDCSGNYVAADSVGTMPQFYGDVVVYKNKCDL